MQLRPYQDAFVGRLSQMLAGGKRKIVGQLATGGGKTVVFSTICQRYTARSGKRALILVHRKELLTQTRHTLYKAYGIIAQPIEAGMKTLPDAPVYVGMVESTYRRAAKLRDIGLVIIDEAHIAAFNKVHDSFPDQMIIGFTATPLSASPKSPMMNHYEDIVCGVDIPELIASGSLCQCVTYAPKDVVDRSTLATKGSDFEEGAMGKEFSKPQYIAGTVRAYQAHAAGTKTIIFNVNIEHSQKVCAAFREAGYDARHLDGFTSGQERAATLQWFKETPDAILCNVAIATTGFDEPSIETVLVNRATKSLPLWLQICGRGARPTETKSLFTIIDLGGNAVKLGEWHNPRNWNHLFHNPPTKKDSEGVPPMKSCPECEALIATACRTCPVCACILPAPPPSPDEELMGELVVLTRGIDVGALMEQNANKKQYASFFQLADRIVSQAQGRIRKMTDELAETLLQEYHGKAREWCHRVNKRYNQWHKDKAKETLHAKLAEKYGWKPAEALEPAA